MFNNIQNLQSYRAFTLEDNSTSPFAVYENETISHEKKYPIPITPTRIDHEILTILSNAHFCTTALILAELSKQRIPFEESNVRNRIHQMCKAEFLMGYHFYTEDGGRSSHMALRLGWRGVGYLRAQGIQTKLGTYLANVAEDPVVTKKILSAVQYIIRSDIPLEDVQFCQAVFAPAKDASKSKKIFRPQGVVQSADKTVFLEAIRQTQNWQTQLAEKLNRIEAVCRARTTNITVRNPTLVLIAESCTHMRMILSMLEKRGCSIPVYFTADTLVYRNPDACLYQLPKSKRFWTSLFAS